MYRRKLTIFFLIISITSVCIFGAADTARAADSDLVDGIIKTTTLLPIATTLAIANTIVVKALVWTVQLFSKVLQMSVTTDLEVVKITWRIVRDFCNMLFIVVLIIMSFGTILGTTFKFFEDFDARKLLVSFLFAALLINFSLPLCQLGASLSQSVSGIFLASIANSADRIGQIIRPAGALGGTIYDQGALGKGDKVPLSQSGSGTRTNCEYVQFGMKFTGILGYFAGTTGTTKAICMATVSGIEAANYIMGSSSGQIINKIVGMFFSTLLTAVVTCSIIGATFFALIRIPIIWLLIVFSPLFVLLNILPQTRSISKRWVTEFISWNTFLPIFLFVLTFGMFFLSSQGIVERGLGVNLKEGFIDSLSLTPEYVLYNIMAALVFIFGTAGAIKASREFGGSAANVFGKYADSIGAIKQYRPAFYTGAMAAKEQRIAQLKKEGLPTGVGKLIYGGKEAEERWTSRVGRFLGVKGQTGYEQFQKRIAEQKGSFEARLKTIPGRAEQQAFLEKLKGAGTVEQQIASRQLLKEKFDALNNKELFDTYTLMGGGKNAEAVKFASGLAFKDMTKSERREWYAKSRSDDVRRKVAVVMRDQGEFKDGTRDERIRDLMEAAQLFGSIERQKQFLKEAGKKDLIAAHNATYKLGLVKDDATGVLLDENSAEAKEELRHRVADLDKEGVKNLAEDDFNIAEVDEGVIDSFAEDDKFAQQVIKSHASQQEKPKAGRLRGSRSKALQRRRQELQKILAQTTDNDRKKKLRDRIADIDEKLSTQP